MKKLTEQLEEQMLDYLDGNLSASQKESFERELEASHVMRTRFQELSTIHESLRDSSLENPTSNFTERVLFKISQLPKSVLSPKQGFLILIGLILATGIGLYLLSNTSLVGFGSLINPQDYKLPEKITTYIPTISWDTKTITNIILIINTGIAFLILDRAILRPLLQKRSGLQS